MHDFVSFNEFVDRTADAKMEHHAETMRDGLRRAAAAKARHSTRTSKKKTTPAVISDDFVEAEFAKMKKYVLEYYKDVQCQHTFVDANGNFIDCIPFEHQATVRAALQAGLALPKKHPELALPEPGGKRHTTDFGPETYSVVSPLRRGAVDWFGRKKACPEGAVPVRRITLGRFAWYGSFERFFRKGQKFGHPRVSGLGGRKKSATTARKNAGKGGKAKPRSLPAPLQAGPDGSGHGHAICQTDFGEYFGCSTWLNVWDEDPRPGSFNLSQLWIIGGQTHANGHQATIESGWLVEPGAPPKLFVFYNPDGYQGFPNGRSGYVNGVGGQGGPGLGFVTVPGAPFFPEGLLDSDLVSSTGVDNQLGINMGWSREDDGTWWLHAGREKFERIGFFPAGAYEPASGLSDHGSVLQFGGEVASSGAVAGSMGSGRKPFTDSHDSFGRVAFQKLISVLPAVNGRLEPAALSRPNPQDGAPEYLASEPESSSKWGRFFFFGGSSSGR